MSTATDETYAQQLAKDNKRVATLVDRYANLEQRLADITEGRDRVRTILSQVALLHRNHLLEGNAHRLNVANWALVRKD